MTSIETKSLEACLAEGLREAVAAKALIMEDGELVIQTLVARVRGWTDGRADSTPCDIWTEAWQDAQEVWRNPV